MRIAPRTLAVLVTAFGFSHQAMAADAPHWTYEGDTGPAKWATLDSSFETCGDGVNQSPIDLRTPVAAEQSAPAFDYSAGGTHVVNNGHAVQVDYQKGSTLTLDGHDFQLKQFHFHAPSEHTIEGRHFPLEAHFVHADPVGNLAVVAVLFEKGEANEALEPLVENLPDSAGDEVELNAAFDAADLLPAETEHYRYNGSLTTPPCSEAVRWVVMQEHPTLSAKQIKAFEKAIGMDNNRPVQPVNARVLID
ncbi:carbonic anhydrase family protein [Guyparkeria sp. GHLCS8-2]|uniref:carbonic anhydrase n=1 Tax=Guyparkeria halopsychrophila TaxID=3139421 RepID=UPI0037C6E565